MKPDIKQLRKAKGYTQLQLSKLIGLNRGYISRIENYQRIPSVKVAKRLGEILEVDWTIFFYE